MGGVKNKRGGKKQKQLENKQLSANSKKLAKKKPKQGAAVAFLKGKTAREPRCPLYFRSAEHRLRFPVL